MVIFYSVVFLFVIYCTIKNRKQPVIFFSYLTLFTVPIILCIIGFYSIYYSICCDFCNSIHTSIYDNHFPINDKGIGKLFSCFSNVNIFFYLNIEY